MYVKRAISPVSLRMVIHTARFAEMTRAFSRDDLAEFLGSSSERAGRVAHETIRIGLIGNEGNEYFTTPLCSRFLQILHASNHVGLHEMMMKHPGYAFFITLLRSASPICLDECMKIQQSGPAPFNRAELDMLCSWAEEIRSVQQNFFTGQYYIIGELRVKFIPTFMKVYHLLETPTGPSNQKKPVRFHILREFVCQKLGIARYDFDSRLTEMYEDQPEEFRLFRRVSNHQQKRRWDKSSWVNRPENYLNFFPGNNLYDGIEIRGKMYRSIICYGGEAR